METHTPQDMSKLDAKLEMFDMFIGIYDKIVTDYQLYTIKINKSRQPLSK